MPALDALPYELWTLCMAFAVDGQEAGPLPLLVVCRRWKSLLLDTPSLWTQIYVRNDENEIPRISTFLGLSKECPLHVYITTPLFTMDYLEPIAAHISRVATISIRSTLWDGHTSLHMEQWKKAVSCIMEKLGNGILPSDAIHTSCFGVSLGNDLYRIILMQFTMVPTIPSLEDHDCSTGVEFTVTNWEDYIKTATRLAADKDAQARAQSIDSISKLASYGRLIHNLWCASKCISSTTSQRCQERHAIFRPVARGR